MPASWEIITHLQGQRACGCQRKTLNFIYQSIPGEFHDQGDTKWIVIRRSLWGHNDTPSGRPAPGRSIGCPGSGCLQSVIGVFQLLSISNTNFKDCPLLVEFTIPNINLPRSIGHFPVEGFHLQDGVDLLVDILALLQVNSTIRGTPNG
jgi:hypothetical protein